MSFALMARVVHHSSHTASGQLVERTDMTSMTTSPSVLIRAARGSDGPALEALAALDSASVPAGALLVAEADGKLVAAVSPSTGERIADPFRRTGDVVELLELRAARGRGHDGRRDRRRLALRAAPRARTA
jgi:hypothetical protein